MGYSELNCLIIDKFLLNRYTPRLHPLAMQRNLNRRLLVRLSEWSRRAKQKQCTDVVLSCKKKIALKYHCLINTWKNLTLSVCAVPTYINGIIVEVYKYIYLESCTKF